MPDIQIAMAIVTAFSLGTYVGHLIGWLKYGRKIFIGKREARG